MEGEASPGLAGTDAIPTYADTLLDVALLHPGYVDTSVQDGFLRCYMFPAGDLAVPFPIELPFSRNETLIADGPAAFGGFVEFGGPECDCEEKQGKHVPGKPCLKCSWLFRGRVRVETAAGPEYYTPEQRGLQLDATAALAAVAYHCLGLPGFVLIGRPTAAGVLPAEAVGANDCNKEDFMRQTPVQSGPLSGAVWGHALACVREGQGGNRCSARMWFLKLAGSAKGERTVCELPCTCVSAPDVNS